MTDAERIAQLEAALAERDALLAQMRAAIDTIPYGSYSDALTEGCDANGAWDCFVEDCEDHLRPFVSADAARHAAEQWRQMREALEACSRAYVAWHRGDSDDARLVDGLGEAYLKARRALGQTEGEGQGARQG